MLRKYSLSFFVLLVLATLFPVAGVSAQAEGIRWGMITNISNTPDANSTDPYVVADPAGYVHLFWAEKVEQTPGSIPDTIMYAKWDGVKWTRPLDLFFSPISDGNPVASFPKAIIDDDGILHLIYMAEPNFPNFSLYYSSVPAAQAEVVHAWQPKRVIAADLSGTKYSASIVFQPPSTLHVVYAHGALGLAPKEERGVSYLRSTDGGLTWSEPVDIHRIIDIQRGASDVRILFQPPSNLYVSWTEWDQSGNGQAIYLGRSTDSGESWLPAVALTVNKDSEYERDWNNLALLPDSRIMSMWEGGYRAYRYAIYSEDGENWSEPVDTFPRLIGENGSSEFVYDSLGRLHLFVAQRIREGSAESQLEGGGLYHSMFMGGTRWREPKLSNGVIPMVNPMVALYNGNRVMAAWTSGTHFEIMVMDGLIPDAPAVAPQPWPDSAQPLAPAAATTAAALPLWATATPALPQAGPGAIPSDQPGEEGNPGRMVLLGVLPSALVILLALVFQRKFHQDKSA